MKRLKKYGSGSYLDMPQNFLRLLLSLTILAFNSSCMSQATVQKTSVIEVNSDKCQVTIQNQRASLNLTPPCVAVKLNKHQPQIRTEYYDDVKKRVLLVVGNTTKIHEDFPLTKSRQDCGDEVQAVLVDEHNLVSVSDVSKGSVICAGLDVDEKLFWTLSHPIQ